MQLSNTDWRDIRGPFDIIGDVHGCAGELIELLGRLGYTASLEDDGARVRTGTPPGRRAFFVGDLVDRGPRSLDVVRIVMHMVAKGHAFVVVGNHDNRFMRLLQGRDVKLTHGLAETVNDFSRASEDFRGRTRGFFEALPSHAWLDGGQLAVAHAGVREDMLGRSSDAVYKFGLYGETSGQPDENGLPERFNWSAHYAGKTCVVYGHTPVAEPEWLNNTLCIDTGCVYGGTLTALRWPERQIVSVPARATYSQRKRPFGRAGGSPKRAP